MSVLSNTGIRAGAAAAGGAIDYPGYDVNKAGEYLIVPWNGSTHDLLFIDSTTGEVEECIPNFGYGGRLYRFGTNILKMDYMSNWTLWSALTLQQLASGYISGNFYTDQVKFASDKILTLGWHGVSGSTQCTAYTHSVSDSGLTQINAYANNSMGVYNSTYGMINNPVIGGQASINQNTGILSAPIGTIGTKAPNNGSSAPAARGSITVNSSGTTIGFNGSTNYNSNFSRPVAATGGNGYCLISGMDGAEVHIFSGSGPGSQVPGNGVHHPPTNGFSPAAILGVSHWLTIKHSSWPNYTYSAAVINSNGISSTFNPPNGSGGQTVQSLPNGAAVVYVDGTEVKFKKYLSSGGWQSPVTVTLLPGPVSNNSVNTGYGVTKIINY